MTQELTIGLREANGRMPSVDLPLQLKTYAGRVDERLRALMPPESESPSELWQAVRYSGLAPGKRLRPALVLAAAHSLGADDPAVLDAACAVEMVHAFSLIHDDLPALDDDDLRRGRPTCHVQFGEAIAILAGDALFALALSTMANVQAPTERTAAGVRVLSRAALRLVAGEALDILSEGTAPSEAVVAQIHREKTAALISASTEIGGIFAGGDEAQISALRTYGDAIGLAFQIADDVLNETATPEQLGKASGSDREREKATYPALFGVEASRAKALDWADQGIAALEPIPERETLTELARFAVARLR
jgi:geranylgeranyl pyrophosphate synthase